MVFTNGEGHFTGQSFELEYSKGGWGYTTSSTQSSSSGTGGYEIIAKWNSLQSNANSAGSANKGGEPRFLEANRKDMTFMANDLTQVYIGANTTLKGSSGYRLAQTTVQLLLGLATRTSTKVLSTISKVGCGIAKAAPWVAGGAIVVDVVSNKQINAGNAYQGVVTGLSLIPGAGLVVGGGALALEGISIILLYW